MTNQPAPANRLGLCYEKLGADFAKFDQPIIDTHAHINGPAAARIYARAAESYSIGRTYSMTHLDQAKAVQEVMGDRIRFIAVPNFMSEDKGFAFRQGFLDDIKRFHAEFGAYIVKFWAAPRFVDYFDPQTDPDMQGLDSPWRNKQAELACELGMSFMVHIGDPDTWFATKYADASRYGTKAEQYAGLERMLDRFDRPWIAAHMGGWPEDLDFLDGLLERHDNLHLDTSATKWMVRELSRHSVERFCTFMKRWKGRILFGSDIVTSDEHLHTSDEDTQRFAAHLASGEQDAFDLYASRYWALKTLLESKYEGESPIADPDLMMVEPDRYDEMSAPALNGKNLPADVLEWIYFRSAHKLFAPWEGGQAAEPGSKRISV